jgi:hypothetical protein
MEFADLYSRYAQDVFRFALYLSGDRDLADEITAETFARALTASYGVQPGSVKAGRLAAELHRDGEYRDCLLDRVLRVAIPDSRADSGRGTTAAEKAVELIERTLSQEARRSGG